MSEFATLFIPPREMNIQPYGFGWYRVVLGCAARALPAAFFPHKTLILTCLTCHGVETLLKDTD